MSLTQADLNQLQARIDAGDRAGFYILYHNLTGSEQALTQAQVSSYSGGYGQIAFFANAAAKLYLGDRYQETTDQFSLSIASDLNNKVRDNVFNGGPGTFTDTEILQFAKIQWDIRNIGNFFPGNIFVGDGFVSTFIGGVVATVGVVATQANEGARTEDPSLIYGPFNRPFDVPEGGQRITSPDGRVTHIVDASGQTVYGSVVINNGPTPSFTFANTIQGDQIHINFMDQGLNGATSMTSTFDTSVVNGVRVVTGQATTVINEVGILQYVAGSSGSSTLTVGNTTLTFENGKFIGATPRGNSIDVVQQQTSGTQTTTVNWDGELERITKLNNDLSSSFQEYDPNNTHPYDKLDVAKGADGKVTAAQVTLDPKLLAAGMSVGQIFGSELGAALGGNDLVGRLVGGAVGGLIGQKFVQVLATSMTADLSQVSLADIFAGQNINIAGAGIGAVSSFLTAELGSALKIPGFGGQLFNVAANGFTVSVLTQVTNSINAGLTFDAAIAAIDWSQAVSGAYNAAQLNLDGILGGYLAHEFVPAKTHEGAVGGALLGAIGNIILPGGLGSLIGTILGTLIGNQFGTSPSPGAVDLIDQAGYYYNYHEYQTSDHGSYTAPDAMAPAADAIINAYLRAVNGVALDHSKQVIVGYIQNPDLLFLSGTPGHPDHSFTSANDAVHAAALDALQNTEVIGGDLLLKRAHHNSPSNDPAKAPGGSAGLPGQPQFSAAEQIVTMSGDLSVAQDYENYLNNREAINALIAANPDSAFTAGWIATFARVNDLKLNQVSASDFLGGLAGWLDSVGKAGLGGAAANATVKRDGGVIVEVKVANGDVPGALSVFADHFNVVSDAGGQTVQFTIDGGIVASGYHFPAATATVGDGANDLWFGGDGGQTFNGTGGHDILTGGAGNDTIHGGAGFDFIDGGAGGDTLFGDDGGDILRGGKGNDILYGGQGNDTYAFARGDGADIVHDHFETLVQDPPGNGPASAPTYHTEAVNAGTDTLAFGPGIGVSDITVALSGNNLIVGVKDPAHPGVQSTDQITLQDWNLAFNRIENFAFADGTTLDLANTPLNVPFGATLSGGAVAEHSPVGTVLGTVHGFDFAPNAVLTYAMVDGAGGRFTADAATGNIMVVNGALLNYDLAQSYSVTVRTYDQVGHWSDTPFTINLIDMPNHAPVLTMPATVINGYGGVPLQVSSWFSAADADNDALTYVFADGTTAANSGQFVLNGTPLGQGAVVSVNAAQLAGLTFVAGAADSADYLSMQLSDSHAAKSADLAFSVHANHEGPFGFDPATTPLANFAIGAGGWSTETQYPRLLADVNGDHMADIVGFGADGVSVALATGSGHFAAPVGGTSNFGYLGSAGGWVSEDQYPRLLADVNGDHMADIVGFGADGVIVALATGNGHFASPVSGIANNFAYLGSAGGWVSENQYPRQLADVNGDGMADIVGFGADGVSVALATGNGHFASPVSGIANFGYLGSAGGWASQDQFPRQLADVNGDGMADIVGFGADGVIVSLATGNGHFASPVSGIANTFGYLGSAGGWSSENQYPRLLADVNGDHMADIVGFGADFVQVSLATGNGHFAAPVAGLHNLTPNAGGWASQDLYPRELGDVSGDGMADVIGFGHDGVFAALSNGFHLV